MDDEREMFCMVAKREWRNDIEREIEIGTENEKIGYQRLLSSFGAREWFWVSGMELLD